MSGRASNFMQAGTRALFRRRRMGVRGRALGPRLIVVGIWFALVVTLTVRHGFWRDEIRAFSFAIAGDGMVGMLRNLQGEGHPAVWYILLRVAYDVVGSPVVLPILSVAVATAAALLLALASPFPTWLLALILAGNPFVFEYSVVARNYGLSAVVLFAMAALYPRGRERGLWLGVLAAVLANTNAHAVLLVGGFMLFWLVDVFWRRRPEWRRGLGVWALNGAIAALGIVVCAATLYPPFNDAADALQPRADLRALLMAVLLPASGFHQMMVYAPARSLGLLPVSLYPASLPHRVLSAVMFGATLGLIRRPGAVLGSLAALLAISVFFVVIYFGSYRHDALWLMFLIALYWIVSAGPAVTEGMVTRWVRRAGFACFAGLLLLQAPVGLRSVADGLAGPPFSPVRDFARMLRSRPDLRGSVLIPDPDYMLEALPYYVDNPIFLPRSGGFGRVSHFVRSGVLALSLGELVEAARLMCRVQGRPVVLVLGADLDRLELPVTLDESYNWKLSVTAAEREALRSSTEFLGRFEPAVMDETFGAYLLRPPCGS